MAGEFDLKLLDGDIAFGPEDEPLFLSGVDVIAQDIRNRLLESGLAADLVGDDAGAGVVLARIADTVELDSRIKPGSANAVETAPGTVTVTARTMDGAVIAETVTA